MKDGIMLSQRELRRLEILDQIEAGGLSIADAARLLALSPRQVRRLRAAYRSGGAIALAHGNRGRRPANAIEPELVRRVLHLASTAYSGWTQKRLAEALAERHGIRLSRASVHRILKRALAGANQAGDATSIG
jgi:transposase